MERSPKGRRIRDVEGHPDDIVARGEKIAALGQQMRECADTLERIKDEVLADGSQQGKAIEELKDSVGDSHDVLRQAAELYEPVGPVIARYGSELSEIQPGLNGDVSDCEAKWALYESLPGDAAGSTSPEARVGVGGYEADSLEAERAASENAAKKLAYEDWLESANAFDTGYDSWSQAFEDAVNGIEDELAGKIKDSFWDEIRSFFKILTQILAFLALIVGVVAIFVTGLAVLAAVLAVGSLLVTAVQYAHGDATVADLVWAAVGFLPIGKVSNLTKIPQFVKLGTRGQHGWRNAATRTWGALDKGDLHTLLSRSGDEPLGWASRTKIREGLIGPSRFQTWTANTDLYKGGNAQLLTGNVAWIRGYSTADWMIKRAGTVLGHWGKIETAVTSVDEDALAKVPSAVGSVVG